MWFIKKFSAIFITIFILIIILLVFSYNIYFKSANNEFRIIETTYKIQNTDIFINTLSGIKSIVSERESSAYFALGYIHAKDRLFQMDIKRRLVQGRLSEVFPNKLFKKSDILFRNIGIVDISKKTIENLDKNTLEILQSYSDGINEYIKNNKNNLSTGFIFNDYFPENWTIENCIEILKLWSLENSIGFKLDLVFADIASKIGINKTLDLLSDSTNENYFDIDISDTTKRFSLLNEIKFSYPYNVLSELNKINVANNENLCNLWIIQDNNTPLLIQDFHSRPFLPSDWYQVHMQFGNWNLVGITIPGYPFIISGRNDFVCWGISNSNIDIFDYFIEKKIGSDYVLSDDDTIKINFIKDTIFLKNEIPSVRYKEKINNRYLLQINPLYQSEKDRSNSGNNKHSFDVTINWTGYNTFKESYTLFEISHSKNIRDIESALNSWGCPNLNFICGDKLGNIALFNIGKIPVRDINNISIIPAKRWDKSYNWISDGKEGINYKSINPKEKNLFIANNQINKDLKSYYYDLPLRFNRIKSLLKEYYSIEDYNYNEFDAKKMLFDNFSNYAILFLKSYKSLFYKYYYNLNTQEKKFINYLYSWNFINVHNKFEPALFDLLISRLLINTFQDELGKNNFKELLNYPHILYKILLKLSNEPYSYWWDDNRTQRIENRAYIVFKSLKEAIIQGEKIYGTKHLKEWQYGKIHKLQLEFIFNKYNSYKINPISIYLSGDFSSLNSTHLNFVTNEMVFVPTMRMIIDLSKDFINVAILGGVSEEPMSLYFKNQLNLWENGGYFQINMNFHNKNLTKLISFK